MKCLLQFIQNSIFFLFQLFCLLFNFISFIMPLLNSWLILFFHKFKIPLFELLLIIFNFIFILFNILKGFLFFLLWHFRCFAIQWIQFSFIALLCQWTDFYSWDGFSRDFQKFGSEILLLHCWLFLDSIFLKIFYSESGFLSFKSFVLSHY